MKEHKSNGNAISKKEIRAKIQDSVNKAIVEFEGEGPSKRVKKVVKKASKKIASKIKRDLKARKTGKKQMADKVKHETAKHPVVV
jgi:hypothetical protein